jgi:hypothetical protein
VPQQELTNLVKANLGAFMGADAPAWLTAAGSVVSIFNIWAVILLMIGFSTVGKLSKGKAAVAALAPWLIWLVVKSSWTMVTG